MSIESVVIKPGNVLVSSGKGGADEEPVFSHNSTYLLEYLLALRKNFSSK